jgi:hypothetical protein
MPIQKRLGNISESVAAACAIIAGCCRLPGAVTTPHGIVIACNAAPGMKMIG